MAPGKQQAASGPVSFYGTVKLPLAQTSTKEAVRNTRYKAKGETMSNHPTNQDAYGDALDATLALIEELGREKRELFCRFLGLLKELHEAEYLSEQQCAKYLGVDLLTWREESQGPYTPHAFEQEAG